MVEHPIVLRGLQTLERQRPPTILQRTDAEFIPAILDELSKVDGLELVLGTQVKSSAEPRRAGAFRLFQPVHRTFHVALVEAACDILGQPRVDPRHIIDAGLVVRRLKSAAVRRRAGEQTAAERNSLPKSVALEGWVQTGNSIQGWREFQGRYEEDLDPNPDFRRPEISAGHAELDRRLSSRFRTPWGQYTESVSPLFVAPPAVCAAAQRTILYGLIPVTSSDISAAPAELLEFDQATRDSLVRRLPNFLTAGGPRNIPRAGQELDHNAAKESGLSEFIGMLHQLKVEFDAFGTTAAAKQLFAELNKLRLQNPDGSTVGAGDFLRQATSVLLERQGLRGGPVAKVRMPATWPQITAPQSAQLLNAIEASIRAAAANFTAGERRFDDPTAIYRLRAFVRVRHREGCPPKIVWSNYSEPFSIAPWYESGDVPPLKIALPNVLDPNALKQLRPNVAFDVPSDVFDFLQGNDPADLLKGEGEERKSGLGLQWICGFSIPIITLCAFILLNIILQLLNFIFQWLPFVKICIPLPKKE